MYRDTKTNSLHETSEAWRSNYATSAEWFLTIAAHAIAHLEETALGEWTVRDLLGHTGRALSTVANYLGAQGPIEVNSAVEYFQIALDTDPAAILERGRAAGTALGTNPPAALASTAATALAAVDAANDDAYAGTPAGVMALAEYLPTRTFELTVHTCDLAVAIGQPPSPPTGPVTSAFVLARMLAGPRAGEVLLALTGRRQLPAGFSVVR